MKIAAHAFLELAFTLLIIFLKFVDPRNTGSSELAELVDLPTWINCPATTALKIFGDFLKRK